jgi:D-glycero-D-manno-heptose 1,7-bisphosphate phosphatase
MKVVFLDRDGVINTHPGDYNYVTSWEGFKFLPGIKPALKKLNDKGFKVFVISNQAGVSKGIFSQQALDLITANMLKELNKERIKIDGVFYCIHRPDDNCLCRKPKTGLIDKALDSLNLREKIDRDKSFFVGDTIRDVETGKSAKLSTILVFSGKEKPENKDNWQIQPDFTACDLSAAVDLILKNK